MLNLWQLILDFGMMVLIWIIQLIVYPSFKHFERPNLIRWHKAYTKRISVIVGPLMIAQMAVCLYGGITHPSAERIVGLVLLVVLWLITFALFVPLHNRINKGSMLGPTLDRLVKANWVRTVLWTFVFILSYLAFN
jgi:hypothetical protein